jgi:hypothetical protein
VGIPHATGDRPHQAEPLDAVEISACQAEWEDGDVVETVPRRILGVSSTEAYFRTQACRFLCRGGATPAPRTPASSRSHGCTPAMTAASSCPVIPFHVGWAAPGPHAAARARKTATAHRAQAQPTLKPPSTCTHGPRSSNKEHTECRTAPSAACAAATWLDSSTKCRGAVILPSVHSPRHSPANTVHAAVGAPRSACTHPVRAFPSSISKWHDKNRRGIGESQSTWNHAQDGVAHPTRCCPARSALAGPPWARE